MSHMAKLAVLVRTFPDLPEQAISGARTGFRFAGNAPEKWRPANTHCFFSCTLCAQPWPPGGAGPPEGARLLKIMSDQGAPEAVAQVAMITVLTFMITESRQGYLLTDDPGQGAPGARRHLTPAHPLARRSPRRAFPAAGPLRAAI